MVDTEKQFYQFQLEDGQSFKDITIDNIKEVLKGVNANFNNTIEFKDLGSGTVMISGYGIDFFAPPTDEYLRTILK